MLLYFRNFFKIWKIFYSKSTYIFLERNSYIKFSIMFIFFLNELVISLSFPSLQELSHTVIEV